MQELIIDFHDALSLKVLQSLWFRTTLLLPNLKKLEWKCDGDQSKITLIRLLLSPSLVHLHVCLGYGDHPSLMGFLECYHILCPNLESLHFSHSGLFPCVITAVSRAVSRTQNLKALSCDFLVEVTLMRIASSRQLESLEASLLDYQPHDLRRLAALGNLPFENLRTLKLRFLDLSSITPYLRSHCQPFEYVSFEFEIAPTHEVLREFFTALASTTRRRTLRRIRLFVESWDEQPIPSQAIDFQLLSLLTSFNLHEFNVNMINPVTLTDDELVYLVQAWPDLEMFYLNENWWGYHSTSNIPTLKGLLHVIERCPKLRGLGLCVDARHVPSLSDAESSICNRAITMLWLADSPIEEPAVERVAQFLLDHFKELRGVFDVSHGHRDIWKLVDGLIRQSR